MIQRADLIVRHAGIRVVEIAIELAGLHAEDAARWPGVTAQAILTARIKPRLHARAIGGGESRVQQIWPQYCRGKNEV